MSYTDEELCDGLRTLAEELGHPPTVSATNAREGVPGADTFVRHFGTWNDALAEAGLETRERGRSEADRRDGLNGASLADYWQCSKCGEPYIRSETLERHIEQQHSTDEGGA